MNYLAIALATVAAMLVGWLWYGPLFGNKWRSLTGNPATNPAVIYPITLVATFVTGYVIAYVTGVTSTALGNGFIVPALFTGFFLWLGFSFARQLINTLFEKKSFTHFFINTCHDLAVALVMATIIGLMGR